MMAASAGTCGRGNGWSYYLYRRGCLRFGRSC